VVEFFAIADVTVDPEALQALTVETQPQYCADIDKVISVEDENNADIFCAWGEFKVQRQIIRGGVRFTLPGCANALIWTITTGFDPAPDKVVIHCTINRPEQDEDFVESIESFVNAYKNGLETAFGSQ